jgi:hypothetical protein
VSTAAGHVVMYSGGLGSYHAARRVVQQYGPGATTLLFADTMTEAPDLHDFLDASCRKLGARLVQLRDGRDIWQVFIDHRFLGNTRIDPCSYFLKRTLMRRWLDENCTPEHTTIHLGIDWSESHRLEKSRSYWSPYKVLAPMCDPPYLDKDQMIAAAEADGLPVPSLYRDGFPHNNCGGGCVKAGQGQFRMLLARRPATYAEWEAGEQRVRDHLQKDVAILRDRRSGRTRPMTLREFRERIQAGMLWVDELDIGGCGCATGDQDEDARVAVALGMPQIRAAK